MRNALTGAGNGACWCVLRAHKQREKNEADTKRADEERNQQLSTMPGSSRPTQQPMVQFKKGFANARLATAQRVSAAVAQQDDADLIRSDADLILSDADLIRPTRAASTPT